MNRRNFISSALMAAIIMIAGLVISTNTASAQCPQYMLDINYIVPNPCQGPAVFDVSWDNGQIDHHSYMIDGKYIHPQPPFPVRMLGVWLCGTFVPLHIKKAVNCPAFGCLPGMCVEIEVKETSPGCYEIKMQPTGGPC